MTSAQRLQTALHWVNETRAKYNIGPALTVLPLGVPCHECECTIARALGGAEVGELTVGWPDLMLDTSSWAVEPIPYEVRKFISAFDEGQYPDLEDAKRVGVFG